MTSLEAKMIIIGEYSFTVVLLLLFNQIHEEHSGKILKKR